MARELAGSITLEINGVIQTNCKSVTPDEEVYRQRAETMSGDGYIEVRPQYGISVEIVEALNNSENGNFRNVTNGTIVVVYPNGRRTIYPNCVCLSCNKGAKTPRSESTFTYSFMCDRPSEI